MSWAAVSPRLESVLQPFGNSGELRRPRSCMTPLILCVPQGACTVRPEFFATTEVRDAGRNRAVARLLHAAGDLHLPP